jgi:hypothetical protein
MLSWFRSVGLSTSRTGPEPASEDSGSSTESTEATVGRNTWVHIIFRRTSPYRPTAGPLRLAGPDE